MRKHPQDSKPLSLYFVLCDTHLFYHKTTWAKLASDRTTTLARQLNIAALLSHFTPRSVLPSIETCAPSQDFSYLVHHRVAFLLRVRRNLRIFTTSLHTCSAFSSSLAHPSTGTYTSTQGLPITYPTIDTMSSSESQMLAVCSVMILRTT